MATAADMNADSSESAAASAGSVGAKRGKFYHQLVTFEIEGVLHRISRDLLIRWSQFFLDMFKVPQGPGEKEGDSDENPIRLSGCTNDEFESLLEVLYPQEDLRHSTLTKERWTGVLKLSRLWEMREVAAIAIEKMSALELTNVEKINLGKAYGVPTWLEEGYAALVSGTSKPSFAEMQDLGSDTAFRIIWARDENYREATLAAATRSFTANKSDIFCNFCFRSGHGRRTPAVFTAYLPRDCTYCNQNPSTSGYGFYVTAFQGLPSDPSFVPTTIAAQVSEVFKEELEEARRRNDPGPEVKGGRIEDTDKK
ncbi:hypothetical protein D9611_010341 [Ephemerocybe angulata]|uniref:BTB domain-containing protein n=1 Tax=Ephemerocybe angulata TaxID=980116 RepID=A0A8H5F1H0_9AGAR|nr:hypothetical protein D9611_010341 [Tulosesus angulatus]